MIILCQKMPSAMVSAQPLFSAEAPQTELLAVDMGTALPSTSYYLVCAKSARHVPRIHAVADLLVAAIPQ